MKSLSFLIDTDWGIDHFNGVTEGTRRLKELQPHGMGLSVVSAAELWEGAFFFHETQNAVKRRSRVLSRASTPKWRRSRKSWWCTAGRARRRGTGNAFMRSCGR